jgi:ribonuclease HI
MTERLEDDSVKYPGTCVYTDGSKRRRGAASYAVLILCNDRFLCEITNAVMDTAATAGQMEIEAICRAINWIAGNPDKARPPYQLFTDNNPFVCLYNGPNWSKRDDPIGLAMKKGKEMGLEVTHIAAHAQEHNGNKVCDITCRALSGAVLKYGVEALSGHLQGGMNTIGSSQYSN